MLARARAVTLAHFPEVARHVGVDPYGMLGRVGLHPGALRDPENWLPAGRVLALLDDTAALTGRDDLGVLLGETRTFASLGPVSLLLRHEDTLRDVIAAMIEYRRYLNDLLHLTLHDDGQSAVLEWDLIPGLSSSQGVGLMATVAYRVLVDGGGFDWQPECIHFRSGQPEHVRTFRRVFRCPVEFDCYFDGMSFSSESLDLVNPCADPELTDQARKLLRLVPNIHLQETTGERARGMIPSLIASGHATGKDLARCLGMRVRTLQRQLVKEGQPFGRLLNDVRRELAVRYLGNSSNSITAVAHMTGYNTLSSFTRWFSGEFGIAPANWRKRVHLRDAVHLSSYFPREAAPGVARSSAYWLRRTKCPGERPSSEIFEAEDDAAAMAVAYRLARGSTAELWQGSRRLAQIEPGS